MRTSGLLVLAPPRAALGAFLLVRKKAQARDIKVIPQLHARSAGNRNTQQPYSLKVANIRFYNLCSIHYIA
jgi:hypothetical protein